MGRTLERYTRVYVDGYDMSGYSRSIGPLEWTFPEITQKSFLDEAAGVLLDTPKISPGTLNAIFDDTADVGIHAALKDAGVSRDVLVALGQLAAPAQGDPVFMGAFGHNGYQISGSSGDLILACPFVKSMPDIAMLYEQPWGVLLHGDITETGDSEVLNTAIGIDDHGSSTSKGGWMMLHLISATSGFAFGILIEHADTNENASFEAIAGLYKDGLTDSDNHSSWIVQIDPDVEIKRYLRWQAAFSGSGSAEFILGFVRGR